MGKYTRKAKISSEVAVMEVSHNQSTSGVRTRARAAASAAAAAGTSLPYLELRSRRLEKLLPLAPTSKPCKVNSKASPEPRVFSERTIPSSRTDSGSVGLDSTMRCSNKDEDEAEATAAEAARDVEVSFGENVTDVEAKERCHFDSNLRYVRETTPCSLISDSDMIVTPGSATRPTNSSATNLSRNTISRDIPTAQKMEEYFGNAEQLQQQNFQEKYNFDFVDEHPLPGRYEWVKPDF